MLLVFFDHMTVAEFSKVATKLLGAYFLIHGIAFLVIAANGVTMRYARPDMASENVGDFLVHVWTFGRPIIYLLAAAALIGKTDWCLEKLKITSDKNRPDDFDT